ncbi:hypothetical protein KY285_010936 [Solanum tuberosum]|nr:hypothetical protein KY289_011508 [Solanum tuberosum]KAH0735229.1 hypothetical protein KY285_010936 [Solanum tuberosum]
MATRNMVLTDEEINAMNQLKLHQSPSHHEAEDKATSERHDVGSDEKYVELKKEIAEVDKHMVEMKAYVDNSTKLIIEKIKSLRSEQRQATHQHDDFRQHVQESEKTQMDQPSVPMMDAQKTTEQTIGVFNVDKYVSSNSKTPTLDDYPNLSMTQIIALDPILNATTTPDMLPRIRNPGRKSTYSKLKDTFEPSMDFGVENVAEKDFFNIMVKQGRPWEDRKAKYSSNPLSYNTVDCWFMSWVNNIEKQWRESNRDMRSISPDHDVGQCIRGFKLLANIPWDTVDDVIIPKVNEAVDKLATMIPLILTSTEFYGKRLDLYADKLSKYVNMFQSDPLDIKHMQAPQQADSSNDCGLYTCIFPELISNGVFDMGDVEIDAKYHRERYATILWHYGKTKNEDGAISESEVTDTVASKFGGPRIAK